MDERRKDIRRKLTSYDVQKKQLKKLQKATEKGQPDKETLMQIEYIESYLREADEMIAKFEELCGKVARKYIVDIFVKHTKIEDIAQKNGVSKRKVEAYLTFWINCYLEDRKPAAKETPWSEQK